MTCIVRDRGLWLTLTCIVTLVSQKKSLMECVVFEMGEPVSVTITVYLISTSQ